MTLPDAGADCGFEPAPATRVPGWWRTSTRSKTKALGVCSNARIAATVAGVAFMNIDRRLLAIIGRRLPAIYDVIPRGPQGGIASDRWVEVMLNPQPLPPQPPDQLGAAVAAEFIHTAWLASRLGIDQGKVFEDLDDWCPTKPKWPKLPPWWWWHQPIPEPPHPDWFIDFHLGFAARLAATASEIEDKSLAESLDRAADRSIKAIGSMKA